MFRKSNDWSPDEIIRFLEEYENHPSLWDRNNSLHRSENKREESLKSIVTAMSKLMPGINLDVVNEKIRTLRNAYNTERTKYENSRGGYRPTLEWYDTADRFWRKVVEPRPSRVNQDSRWDRTQDSIQEAEEERSFGNVWMCTVSSLYGADRSYDCSPSKQTRISGSTSKKRKIDYEDEEEESCEKNDKDELTEDLKRKLAYMKEEHDLRMEFLVRKEELQYKILEAELLLKQRQLQ